MIISVSSDYSTWNGKTPVSYQPGKCSLSHKLTTMANLIKKWDLFDMIYGRSWLEAQTGDHGSLLS